MAEYPQNGGPDRKADRDLAVAFDAFEADWDPQTLNLDAYLDRIGLTGPREPSLKTLIEIHQAHSQAISFENLDLPIGRGIRVALADIERKLVGGRRGGYCFEQNSLLAAALTRLGFALRRGSARGPMGPKGQNPLAYGNGHAMLVVDVGGQSFLCDVGVGYLGPSMPVPLIARGEFDDGGWRYRTDRVTVGSHFAGWMLRILLPDGWSNVYAFSDQPVFHVDYNDQNFRATDHPESPFRAQFIVQRTGPEERWSLRDLELTLRRPGEQPDVRAIRPDDYREMLGERFGLHLDEQTAECVAAFVLTKTAPR